MPKGNSLNTLGWYGVLAFELGWIVAAGSLLGYYADNYLGTSPWLTSVGAIGSAAGALYRLVVGLGKIAQREHDDRKN